MNAVRAVVNFHRAMPYIACTVLSQHRTRECFAWIYAYTFILHVNDEVFSDHFSINTLNSIGVISIIFIVIIIRVIGIISA